MYRYKVRETTGVVGYLQKHQLLKPYKKVKHLLESGYGQRVGLKKRQPKEQGIFAFRITKQYRALAVRVGDTLRVFAIDDHQ